MPIKTKQNGFTFLEVMIAVAIIAIAFVTLLGSQSQSVSVSSEIRIKVRATMLAQQKLTELESTDFDELYSSEGDFGEDSALFRWEAEVSTLTGDDIGIEGVDDQLKEIDLTIYAGDSEQGVFSTRAIVMRKIDSEEND